ncbi:MAG: alpha/beta hydrolase [Halobacteriota archaeon]
MADRADRPDPEVEALLEGMELPPRRAQTVEAARAALDAVLIEDEPTTPVDVVREFEIPVNGGGVRVRSYRQTSDEPRPILVYLHGGGWVRGNIDTHDDLCRRLARALGMSVLSVDYRRAPEHPFPGPLLDSYAAVEWAIRYADLIGGDANRVAVGGDSAGGNLAAAVTLMARDMDGPTIDLQLLLYPITNHAFDTASYVENAEGYLLTRDGMRWYWEQYLERELDGRHPYASPLVARELGGLPPAVVVTAGYDPLRDEGEAYADRLADAGVPVEHLHYPAMLHAFLSFPSLARTDEAMDELSAAVAALFG